MCEGQKKKKKRLAQSTQLRVLIAFYINGLLIFVRESSASLQFQGMGAIQLDSPTLIVLVGFVVVTAVLSKLLVLEL